MDCSSVDCSSSVIGAVVVVVEIVDCVAVEVVVSDVISDDDADVSDDEVDVIDGSERGILSSIFSFEAALFLAPQNWCNVILLDLFMSSEKRKTRIKIRKISEY